MDRYVDRLAVLANGESVSLRRAAVVLGHLQLYLEDRSGERDAIYFLREACLGRPLEHEQTQVLVREQFLAPDGAIDNVLRAVVLSSVRGEGRLVRVSSPFTDPLDRHIADFLLAREYLTAFLDKDEFEAWMNTDPVRDALREAVDQVPYAPPTPAEAVRRVRNWTERAAIATENPTGPPAPPPLP